MPYQPPTSQILLAMQVARAFQATPERDLSRADTEAIITEAGRFAVERIAPLDRVGDRQPSALRDGKVVTPPGWREAYADWCAGGWNGLTAAPNYGGQGLPMVLAVACTEIWNAASMAFALCPLLTTGAIEAITAHASPGLRQRYLPKLVSGEWSGTMNLTEPQAGSDLSLLRCAAQRMDDGSYRITGNKIFITYGEHDCTSNIVHLVLARLPDAPKGTRGVSLFLVPKILPDGRHNDLHCHSLEHKLGIHGSPTCSMVYGDKGGAVGWLIGEENQGLACMFTMMNNARLLVGVQGVAIAERATQMALAYASERRQGRGPASGAAAVTILQHPDIRRMLAEMQGKTAAARALCMATAAAIDESMREGPSEERSLASVRASLLTPLAKAYATDIAVEVTSAAIQVRGGMGYIEETGVAQLYRDARILPIYEGTNGIQAIDLVTRKIGPEGGDALQELLADTQSNLSEVLGADAAAEVVARVACLAATLGRSPTSQGSLAAATPFLRALAATVAGGYMARSARCAAEDELGKHASFIARIYLGTELPVAIAAAEAATESAALFS